MTYFAKDVQSLCGNSSICVISAYSTVIMDSNLNLFALIIRGKLIWTDDTQKSSLQWICAGYIVVENQGILNMSIQSPSLQSILYIKDNGAVHPILRTRVFGGVGAAQNNNFPSSSGPLIDIKGNHAMKFMATISKLGYSMNPNISGRKLIRTWSLLASPAAIGVNFVTLLHNPVAMGWAVGDRILISPTTLRSSGTAQSFIIGSMSPSSNKLYFQQSTITNQAFDSKIVNTGKAGVAILSAEVINLSRNVIITGDDYRHQTCDSSLTGPFSTIGCNCNSDIGRSVCTFGLHTMMSGNGVLKMQYSRVEKCGQRGVRGKYCMHLHFMGQCPDCLIRGNAIENGQQRGIVLHETHRATVEDNVLSDVRGSGIFIEDGNELFNRILYNVVICPWPLYSTTKFGCTVPGTDNSQADTSVNQAGLWSLTPRNDVIGNRLANSFNGMFYDCGDIPRGIGAAEGHVNTFNTPMGRLDGNTFHGHGRFGTYILNYMPKKCYPNITANGWITDSSGCTAFTKFGEDNGIGVIVSHSVDYQNAFVGQYNAGDMQYFQHASFSNNNNIYWKETKNFADGCSAHISNGYYADGNMALPDMAAFIIEDTVFTGNSQFEANHHCNIGVTGYLCMPTYVLSNVSWVGITSTQWVQFHIEANNNGLNDLFILL